MSRAPAGSGSRRLRVLQSFRANGARTNPYVIQLARALGAHVEVANFGWRVALLGRYDVFHVHWPEVMLRGRTPSRAAGRRLLFLALLLRLRVTRRPLVRTRHNLRPHEPAGRIDRALLRLCDRWTTLTVRLTAHTPAAEFGTTVTIAHGHYRDWYTRRDDVAIVDRRVLYFGLLRRYKGVLELLALMAGHPDAPVRLRLVGSADGDAELAEAVLAAADADLRVSATLEYVSDAQLAEELAAAALVVLPYREMHNSGAALLALSMNRPVLVPDNAVTRELAAEVGGAWVQTYTGEVSMAAVEAALARIAVDDGRPPRLDRRDWPELAQAHVEAYRSALAARRPRRAAFPTPPGTTARTPRVGAR